jgi:hypothetical protein
MATVINTKFIQLTVKQVGTQVLRTAKLMQINIEGAKLKYVDATTTEIVLADRSQNYRVYETPDQISMLQDPTSTNPFYVDKKTDYTAGTTQTQAGATALTKYLNSIATCANASDGVALPVAAAGKVCVIINAGAAAAKVWPENTQNDKIDGGAADAADANTIAAGGKRTYLGIDADNWITVNY